MGSREKMGEHAGFGDFGGDMELEEGQNLPFGVPEEDSVVSMGTESGEMDFGNKGGRWTLWSGYGYGGGKGRNERGAYH